MWRIVRQEFGACHLRTDSPPVSPSNGKAPHCTNNLDIFDIFLYVLKDLHLSRSTLEYNKFDSICKQIYRENISKVADYITYEKKSLGNCEDHSLFDFISAVLYIYHSQLTVFLISTQECWLTVGRQSVICQSIVGHLTVVCRQYVSLFFRTWRSWFKLFQHLQTNLSWKYLKSAEFHYF